MRRMHRTLRLLPTLLIPLGIVLLAFNLNARESSGADAVRVWVDSTGSHAIEATMVDLKNDVAVLMTREGKRLSIRIEKLSDNDKQYIAEVGRPKLNHQRLKAPQPPEIKPLPMLELPQAERVATKGSVFNVEASRLVQGLTTSPGVLLPDRAPIEIRIANQDFRLEAIDSYDVVSNVLSVGTSDAPALGASISDGFSASGKVKSINRLIRFDAITSQAKIIMRSADRIHLLDHHPASGRSLLLLGHNPLGHGGRLVLGSGWDDASMSFENEHVFLDDEKLGQSPHVRWARLIDDEHFVAVIDRTFFAANIVSGEVLYKIDGIDSKSSPAVSGGRRYVAIPHDGGVQLYQTTDGKALGLVKTDKSMVPAVSFSNSGASLAIVTPRRLRIWSLPGAVMLRDISTRRSLGNASPVWIDADLILTSSGVLMSVSRGVPVWRYEIAGAVTSNVSGHVAILRKSPKAGLNVLTLPHSGAYKAMQWIDAIATTTDPEQWRVPGRSVWSPAGWTDRDVRVSARASRLR